jgi:hypothetical protein
LETLREKVNAAVLAAEPNTSDTPPVADLGQSNPVEDGVRAETLSEKRRRLRMEAARLVRIRVVCMNPMKKDWEGEIFTVANAVVGTFKKYVPFGNDEGWHVPNIIYQQIKSRMCQTFVNAKSRNGVTIRQGKLIKEFAVEVLPDLTEAELKELAQRQAMAGSVE